MHIDLHLILLFFLAFEEVLFSAFSLLDWTVGSLCPPRLNEGDRPLQKLVFWEGRGGLLLVPPPFFGRFPFKVWFCGEVSGQLKVKVSWQKNKCKIRLERTIFIKIFLFCPKKETQMPWGNKQSGKERKNAFRQKSLFTITIRNYPSIDFSKV